MPPAILPFLPTLFAAASFATAVATRPDVPQLEGGPKPPELEDAAIAAARRRQISASARRGVRSSSILAGRDRERFGTLETEQATLLGGPGG